MFRYGPRFGYPIEPFMEGPVQPTQFRGGPQKGPLSQQNGGSMASGTMQGPNQQGGGGLGIGDAASAGGLLAKLAGGGASPLAGLGKQAGMLGDPLLGMGGTNSLDAFLGAGKGAGDIGSFMGGIAGAGGAGGSPFPAMGGLLEAGMTGADLGPMADLGIEAAASGGNPLALSNPYTAALAAPGLLNSILGTNIPDPFSFLSDLF